MSLAWADVLIAVTGRAPPLWDDGRWAARPECGFGSALSLFPETGGQPSS